jgi:hypothetical protein
VRNRVREQGPIATGVSWAKIASSIALHRGHNAVWVPDRRSLALTCPGRRGVSFRFNYQTARGYASAFSRRDAPELCFGFHPQTRGRRESRVRAAPAVSRAKGIKQKRTRAYRFSGSSPAFPAQWFYGLLRDLPGETSSIATVASQIISRQAWRQRRAPEPRDFAVRSSHDRQSQPLRPPHPTARS